MKVLGIGLALMLCAHVAEAQIPANPRTLMFKCPDHDKDTDHEVDIIEVATGNVVQTLQGGDPPVNGNGDVVIAINVHPVEFGRYRFVVRAVAGTLKSPSSDPSVVWERQPAKPTQPVIGLE